jgi:hypothetical protein
VDSTARSANVQELLISRVERVQERAARPAVLSSGASGNDSSFFKTEITVLAGSRRADDHVIDQLQLKDFAGFNDSTSKPEISFRRGWITRGMVVDHDEGVSAEGNYRFFS